MQSLSRSVEVTVEQRLAESSLTLETHEVRFTELQHRLEATAGEAHWAAETALAQAELAVREQGMAMDTRVGSVERALSSYLRAACED